MNDTERKLLAQALLSHAPEIERYGSSRRQELLEGLELLKTLEPIAYRTIHPEAEAHRIREAAIAEQASAPPSPTATSQSVAKPGQAASAHFSSDRNAYRPALKDPGVVDALLAFHRKNAPARGPASNFKKRLDHANGGTSSKHPSPAAASSRGFQASNAPKIEAKPKPQTTSAQGTRIPSGRILRPGQS